jgi:hypothetical protein
VALELSYILLMLFNIDMAMQYRTGVPYIVRAVLAYGVLAYGVNVTVMFATTT